MRLGDGTETLAYCANPGASLQGLEPGAPCLLWDSGNPTRSRRYTWRAAKLGRTWVATDTHLVNEVVARTLRANLVPAFSGLEITQVEPPAGRRGRFDFALANARGDRSLLEAKSVMIAEHGAARYPDSHSPRLTNQLRALTKEVRAGRRAILYFVVLRSDVAVLNLHTRFDPSFSRALATALRAGVEILAAKHAITRTGYGQPQLLPVKLLPSC